MLDRVRREIGVLAAAVVAVFLVAAAARAEEKAAPAPAGPLKIGVIDLDRLMRGSEAGGQARNKLTAMQKQEEEYINKEEEALRKMQEYLQANSLMLNEETRDDKSEELRKKKVALDRQMEDFKAEYIKTESKLVLEIQNAVLPIIKDYAKKNGLTLVLNSRSKPSQEVLGGYILYVDQAVDITDTITSLYNIQWNKQKSKAE